MLALDESPVGVTETNGKQAASAEQHPAPIIVYGAPRSGTGYLSSILNQHPDIFISSETRLFVWLDQALNTLTQNEKGLLNHGTEFVYHLRTTLPQVIRDFYRRLRPTRYWGDKNPHYAAPAHRGSLLTIAALFPGARFIHIIRDGRDVVTSLLRKAWVDFDKAHEVWKGHVDTGREFGVSQPPGAYFELRYEELIGDDLGVTRSLFEFLNISLHESVANFCTLQKTSRTPIGQPTRDLGRGATSSDWANLLTPEQRLRSLELLARHLIKYGYATPDSFALAYQEAARLNSRLLVAPLWRATSTLPRGATVLVISKGDDALLDLPVTHAWHFPQTAEGAYAGFYPAESNEAISHLECLREKGADHLLIPETSFWWLDYYTGFRDHLEGRYRCIWSDGNCRLYAIREPVR